MKPDRQEELQESLDFLRGRFEELNRDIKLPHSLDAEVLRARLEEIEEVPEERSGKVIRWRRDRERRGLLCGGARRGMVFEFRRGEIRRPA